MKGIAPWDVRTFSSLEKHWETYRTQGWLDPSPGADRPASVLRASSPDDRFWSDFRDVAWEDRGKLKWTHVVLQSWAGDDRAGLPSSYAVYARRFARVLRQAGAKIVLFGHPRELNAEPIPDGATVQLPEDTARFYRDLAAELNATVVPAFYVQALCHQRRPGLRLRWVNNSHPNQECMYLTACTFYSVLTGRNPAGLALRTVVYRQDSSARTHTRERSEAMKKELTVVALAVWTSAWAAGPARGAIETSWFRLEDGPAWIREGLLDQVVLSQWLSAISFDPPVELWKDIIQDRRITLALNVSTSTSPFNRDHLGRPGLKSLNNTIELLRGAALGAYRKGVDRVYLFNYCYYESTDPAHLRTILSELGSVEAMRGKPRRHLVGFQEIAAPGMPESSVLPVRFDETRGISKYGTTVTVCPYIGPAPEGRPAGVVIGFLRDADLPGGPEDLHARVNGTSCPLAVDAPAPKEFPDWVAPRFTFAVPDGVLHDGRNSLEIESASRRGTLVWAEVYIR